MLNRKVRLIIAVKEFLVDFPAEIVSVGQGDRARPMPSHVDDLDRPLGQHTVDQSALDQFLKPCHGHQPPARWGVQSIQHEASIGEHPGRIGSSPYIAERTLSLPTVPPAFRRRALTVACSA